MNKLLIVLLAVCLVSTHAFVKRDAPATTDATNALQKQIADLQAQLLELGKNISDQTAAALNPDNIKNELEKALAAAKEVIDKFKPAATEETKPAA